MTKTLIAGAVAVMTLAGGSAFAQAAPTQAYIGANLGTSHAGHGCGAGASASTDITDCDKSDFAWKLYGGYNLPGTPFAAELTYANLGTYKAKGTDSASAKGSYWGVGGAWRPEFGQGWGGVARLGAAYSTSKVDYSIAEVAGEHSKDSWHPYYGLGVNYQLTRNVKLEADWDNTRVTGQVPSYGSSTSVVNTYSIGASLGF
jgi:hypothetical protein